jgi:cytochrome c553
MKHAKYLGKGGEQNCVVACASCHDNAHEGKNYRFGTVVGNKEDYPSFSGQYLRERVAP